MLELGINLRAAGEGSTATDRASTAPLLTHELSGLLPKTSQKQ